MPTADDSSGSDATVASTATPDLSTSTATASATSLSSAAAAKDSAVTNTEALSAAELQQLILQVKAEEAPFVGPRSHLGPELNRNREFFLEEDLWGSGLDASTSADSTMLEFLHVLMCQNPQNPFYNACLAPQVAPQVTAATAAAANTGSPTSENAKNSGHDSDSKSDSKSDSAPAAASAASASAAPVITYIAGTQECVADTDTQKHQEPATATQKQSPCIFAATDLHPILFLNTRRVMLRRLVFNNPYIDYIEQRNDLATNEAKWREWMRLFIESNHWIRKNRSSSSSLGNLNPQEAAAAGTLDESEEELTDASVIAETDYVAEVDLSFKREDLQYLPEIFKQDFSKFVREISLLRMWELSDTSREGRNWSTRFLFPHGNMMLYPDIGARDLSASTNDLNGSGQLLYYFLQRSTHDLQGSGNEAENSLVTLSDGTSVTLLQLQSFVGRELWQRFFSDNPINAFAKHLSGAFAEEENFVQTYLQEHGCEILTEQGRKTFAQALKTAKNDLQHPWPKHNFTSSTIKALNYFSVYAHRVFQQMLLDFASILSMGLSNQELFQALGQISLLNFLVYTLEQTKGALLLSGKKASELDINIIPVINPSPKDQIRHCSVYRCRQNNDYTMEFESLYFRKHIASLVKLAAPQLTRAKSLNAQQIELLFTLIESLFNFNKQSVHYLRSFVQYFVDKKRQQNLSATQTYDPKSANVGAFNRRKRANENLSFDSMVLASYKVTYREIVELCQHYVQIIDRSMPNTHFKLGRSIGLITTELTNGHCYYLSDQLVRTLVMAVVGRAKYMSLAQFLAQLAQRYHIVIGPQEAQPYYTKGKLFAKQLKLQELDDELSKNVKAFREQLQRLGLLLSLSDYCDFVKNPFYHPESAPSMPSLDPNMTAAAATAASTTATAATASTAAADAAIAANAATGKAG